MRNKAKLRIAGVTIGFKSNFPIRPLTKAGDRRFKPFIYRGRKRPDIDLEVKLIKGNPPGIDVKKRLFFMRHPQDKKICWAIFRSNRGYVLMTYSPGNKQRIAINRAFNNGVAYLYTGKRDVQNWPLSVIIYDALQIILQNYLINHKGFLLHSMGVDDFNNKGLVFIGKSGAGKTTMARLWHKYSGAKVLNDDRTIARAENGTFYLYGTPWHGDFNDYLVSLPQRVELNKLIFISHSRTNRLNEIKNHDVYKYLFQNIFFTFWDKAGLKKAIDLSRDLARRVPACCLGFKDTKGVIDFIRKNI